MERKPSHFGSNESAPLGISGTDLASIGATGGITGNFMRPIVTDRLARRGGSADMAELSLTADCARCTGLCCVAPAFSASSDFAIDKPADEPCPHLEASFRCGIRTTLRGREF